MDNFTINYRDGIWYASLERHQSTARQTLKEAGFKFCWGSSSGKCYRYCKACKLGLSFIWFTPDPAVAARFPKFLSPAATAAVEAVRRVADASRAVEADVHAPAPPGLDYLGYQRAGISWLLTHEATLLGDEMGLGKGQPSSSYVLTPRGFARLGKLKVGDEVVGADGRATKLTGVFHRGMLPVYRVTFSDGTSLVVDGDHLWSVRTGNDQFRGAEWRVLSTIELKDSVERGESWRIPMAQPARMETMPEIPEALPAYILGVLLGDGHLAHHPTTYTPGDTRVPAFVAAMLPKNHQQISIMQEGRATSYRITTHPQSAPNPMLEMMRTLCLSGIKAEERHVPWLYLFNKPEHRLALLQGLLDTDGEARPDGVIEFCSASEQLVHDVATLCESFGGVARIGKPRQGKYMKPTGEIILCKMSYRVRLSFPPEINPFLAHADRYVPKTKYLPTRIIRSIEPEGEDDVICIQVDAEDQLYVTEHYIVTHNTIQVLGAINADKSICNVLVICPSSLRVNWVREAQRWLVRENDCRVVETAADLCAPAGPGQVCLVACNYERLIKARGKGLSDALRARQWDIVVVDEAHKIKNPKAQQSKVILGTPAKRASKGKPAAEAVPGLIAQGKRKAFLTGTPIANRPVELWPLISALRPDTWSNFFSFAKRYCNAQQVKVSRTKVVWDFSGASNLEELQTKLRTEGGGLMIRRLKHQVLTELPPKRRQLLSLPVDDPKLQELIASQLSDYEDVQQALDLSEADQAIAHVRGEDAQLQEAVANMNKARQVSFEAMSHMRAQLGKYKVEPASEYIIESLEGGTDKIVVFAHHKEVIDQMMAKLAEYHPVKLTGETPMVERQRAVDAFQQDPGVRVFIGNILAAGVGLTLTAASTVVFAEYDWVPANLVQAEDRCHRIGQADSVMVHYLVFDGSLDQRLLSAIIAKLNIADQALDQQSKQQVLDGAMDDALAKATRPRLETVASTPIYTEHQRELAREGIVELASVCDGAVKKDDMGFSGQWVRAGHWLAGLERFDDRQMGIALRVLRWHHRQLPESLLEALKVEK